MTSSAGLGSVSFSAQRMYTSCEDPSLANLNNRKLRAFQGPEPLLDFFVFCFLLLNKTTLATLYIDMCRVKVIKIIIYIS